MRSALALLVLSAGFLAPQSSAGSFALRLPAGALALQSPAHVDAKGAVAAAAVPAVQRIAVIGAGLSDGFGLDAEVGENIQVTLSDVVAASLLADHDPILHKASPLLFANPVQIGRESVAMAKAKDPTIVVGIDFLFWFGYGAVQSEGERLPLLEKGLGLLSDFTCPVLVGDFADVSDAVAGTTPETKHLMLAKEQVPATETLKKLNERLRAWAGKHENVVVVPVADLLARVRADEEIAVRGNRWFKGSLKALLQKDRLYPTLEGTIAIWLSGLDALVSAREDVPASAFDWDRKSIWRKVYASKEGERRAEFERKKKRLPKPVEPPPQPVVPGKGKGGGDRSSGGGDRGG